MPFAAWVQILAVIGIIELTVGKQDYENKVRRRVVVQTLLDLLVIRYCCSL